MNDTTTTPANEYTELNQTLAHVDIELQLAKKRVKELSQTKRRLEHAKKTLEGLGK